MISNVILHSLPRATASTWSAASGVAAPMLRALDDDSRQRVASASVELTKTAAAVERPTPTRPQPTLRILETRVLRGPNFWARVPGHRDARRPGRARGVPEQHDPRLQRGADRADARRSRTMPARSAGAAASSRGSRTARGWATWPSTSRWSCRASPARTSHSARRARPASTAATTSSTSSARSTSACEAGRIAVALVNHLVAPDEAPLDFAEEIERLIRLAERAAFGPSTAGDHRRGGLARHPLDPARPAQPRAAGPGRPPAAHPRDDDLAHERHRRRHRLGQGAHQRAAQRPPACPCRAPRSCARRTARSRRPREIGYPGAWSSRSTATTAAA